MCGYHTPPFFFLTKPARTVCFKFFIKYNNCSIHFVNYQKKCATIFITQCFGSTTSIFLTENFLYFYFKQVMVKIPKSDNKGTLIFFAKEQALSWKFYMWATNHPAKSFSCKIVWVIYHPRKDFWPGNINIFSLAIISIVFKVFSIVFSIFCL